MLTAHGIPKEKWMLINGINTEESQKVNPKLSSKSHRDRLEVLNLPTQYTKVQTISW